MQRPPTPAAGRRLAGGFVEQGYADGVEKLRLGAGLVKLHEALRAAGAIEERTGADAAVSDVILHLQYTAREGGDALKEDVFVIIEYSAS